MSPRAFRFDPNRCTGCQACVIACGTENHPGVFGAGALSWRQVVVFNETHHPAAPTYALSLACQHCAEPACLAACPALAYTKDPATGAVLLDRDACLGCRYCTWACPHDAPRFDETSRTISKCTFCHHRLADGRAPACVTACPTDALGLVDAAESCPSPPGTIAGFEPRATRPALRVVPLRGGAPRLEAPASGLPAHVARRAGSARIAPRDEWPLLVFTLTVTLLVGVVLAAVLGAWPLGGPRALAWLVAIAGGGSLLVSLGHLGRPERAWRAMRGWRTSWVSREIVLVPAFLAGAVAWSWSANPAPPFAGPLTPVALAVAMLGLASAFAVDRVYAVIEPVTGTVAPGRTPLVGPVLVGALWLASVSASLGPLALLFAAWKTWFTLAVLGRASRTPFARTAGALRVLAGLALPAALAIAAPMRGGALVLPSLALALAGEGVERVLFYGSLSVTTPRLEADAALARGAPAPGRAHEGVVVVRASEDAAR